MTTLVQGPATGQGVIQSFDSVSDMVAAQHLIVGDAVQTLGYYNAGDKGAARYVNRGTGWPITADDKIDHAGFGGIFLELQHNGQVDILQAGAYELAIGSTTGDSSRDAIQACLDYGSLNGTETTASGGAYYIDSVIDVPQVNDGLGLKQLILKGNGRLTTELFTDQNIDMFIHRDRFAVRDLTVVQRATGDGITGNKWTGVAFRANGQCRFCDFSNLEIWWFKFGHLQRFSLWNRYENIYYVHNKCGVKLARSDDMEDVTNPSPTGSWNASDGWFHNMNSWTNIVFNGGSGSTPNEGQGEVGFWGAIQGNSMRDMTFQNYNRDGTQNNTILPAGEVALPIFIGGGGPTSSDTFNNDGSNWYFERNKKNLELEDVRGMVIDGWFSQGQSGGDDMITLDNSRLTIFAPTGQSPGFVNRVRATNNSTLISDVVIPAPSAANNLDATSKYEITVTGDDGEFVATMGTETSGTITLDSAADTLSYTKVGRQVTVTGRVDISSVSSPVGNFVTIENLPYPAANLTERAGNAGGGFGVMFGGVPSPQTLPSLVLESASEARLYVDASTLSTEQFYISFSYVTN